MIGLFALLTVPLSFSFAAKSEFGQLYYDGEMVRDHYFASKD